MSVTHDFDSDPSSSTAQSNSTSDPIRVVLGLQFVFEIGSDVYTPDHLVDHSLVDILGLRRWIGHGRCLG